jgi:hypothetical protein
MNFLAYIIFYFINYFKKILIYLKNVLFILIQFYKTNILMGFDPELQIDKCIKIYVLKNCIKINKWFFLID